MDVHLLLSATIKVVKMEHKKKKITMGFALLLCAMVALVGVGYALAYQGSATTPVDPTSDEFIKVGITEKTGIFNGHTPAESQIYTVNTLNNGSTITVDSLKVGNNTATLVTGKYFVYSSAFSIANAKDGYESSVAGSISLSVLLSSGATTSGQAFEMAITNLNAGVLHPNGVSLLYTYKIGTDGNETILDLNNLPTVTLEAGTPVDVTFTAYVVYKMSVSTNDFDTGSFAIAGNSDVRFTFSVPTA